MDGIKHFSETMESLYKPYFLFAGTLLGGYRFINFFNLKVSINYNFAP